MAQEPDEIARVKRLKEYLGASAAPDVLVHLARAVLGNADPAISHAEVLAKLPSYVADEIGGLPVGKLYADVKRHLDLCTGCEAEYLSFLSLAQLEAAGELSAPARVPQPDLSFLSQQVSLLSYVSTLAKDLVTILQPDALLDFQAMADAFFKWIGRQGGQLILVRADLGEALGINEGALSDVALILMATQLTTQSLVDALSPEEVQVKVTHDYLQRLALEHAERSAEKAGLDSRAAREFARQYAKQIAQKADMLRELSRQRSS